MRVRTTIWVVSMSIVLSLIWVLIFHKNDLIAAQQTPQCQTFPETGKSVCGKFLQYWDQHGGLAQNGLPISDQFGEISPLDGNYYTVQYFERAEFELHPENKPPYDILLAQLGTFRFKEKYSGPGPQLPMHTPVPVPTAARGRGVIAGMLGYPSEVIPKLDVYIIEVNGTRYYSIRTNDDQQDFAIGGIQPGNYYAVAYSTAAAKGDPAMSGYTKAVLCGLNFQCADHSLIPVSVNAGDVIRGIQVTDFTPPPGGFQPKP